MVLIEIRQTLNALCRIHIIFDTCSHVYLLKILWLARSTQSTTSTKRHCLFTFANSWSFRHKIRIPHLKPKFRLYPNLAHIFIRMHSICETHTYLFMGYWTWWTRCKFILWNKGIESRLKLWRPNFDEHIFVYFCQIQRCNYGNAVSPVKKRRRTSSKRQ